MVRRNCNNIVYVLKVTVLYFTSKVLFTVLAALLHFVIPVVPGITMAMLAAIMSCIFTILYLIFETKYVPVCVINVKVFWYFVFGFITVCMANIVLSKIFPGKSSAILELVRCAKFYRYVNVICLVGLGPVAEEIIYRGYFLKLLMRNGKLVSVSITSLIFATLHLISNYNGFDLAMCSYGVYFFLFSAIAGFVYIRAGLCAAILVHIFSNLYVLVMNT